MWGLPHEYCLLWQQQRPHGGEQGSQAWQEGLELLDQAAERPDVGVVGGAWERVERLDEAVVDPIAIR